MKKYKNTCYRERAHLIIAIAIFVCTLISFIFVSLSIHNAKTALSYSTQAVGYAQISANQAQRAVDIVTNREYIVACMDKELIEFKCDTCLGGYEEKGFNENADRVFELCLERAKEIK